MRRITATLRWGVLVFAVLFALGGLPGCAEEVALDQGTESVQPGGDPDPGTPAEREGVGVSASDRGPADLFGERPVITDPPDDPPVEVEPGTRVRRRMDIDQLDVAIRQVTGGIGWTELRGGRPVDLFEDLAETLGRPDYLDTTIENLEPSALFQKFLGDAARAVCTELVEADRSVPPEERVLFTAVAPEDTVATNPEGVDANLRYLLLRYHGRHLAPGDPELEPWRWLFESALHVTAEPTAAWRTVCVGLITHPNFYTY